MATIQLGRTQTANKLLSYAEKRSDVTEGLNCQPAYAKAQMRATRELWGKTGGVQAHHVIQAFPEGEVTPELANKIGQDLAREIAKGHEVVVYTHTDKAHIHNHIVINSVNYEDGSKYQAHGKDAIQEVRDASDRLCLERGLSVVQEKTAATRYTLAEQALVEKGQHSWKDEIRDKVDVTKNEAWNFDQFKQIMLERHEIEVLERGKNITYVNLETGKKVRGNKLGNDYDKETMKHEFAKRQEQETTRRGTDSELGRSGDNPKERGSGAVQRGVSRDEEVRYDIGRTGRIEEATPRVADDSKGFEQYRKRVAGSTEAGRGVSIDAPEGGHAEGTRDHGRTGPDQPGEPRSSRTSDFDFDEFNRRLEERKHDLKEGHRQQHQRDRSSDRPTSERIGEKQGDDREQIERNREEKQKGHGRHKPLDLDFGPER
ncbi:MAG: relaxase/mobilization nuclease domain-containing protein [Exiguobacterium mexicanum]